MMMSGINEFLQNLPSSAYVLQSSRDLCCLGGERGAQTVGAQSGSSSGNVTS